MFQLVIQSTPDAVCGDPRSPSGHVWSSRLIPPSDDLPCLCGQLTWRDGIQSAVIRRRLEQGLPAQVSDDGELP